MIERLARALEHSDELSPDAQEDIAEQIEELILATPTQVPQPLGPRWSTSPSECVDH